MKRCLAFLLPASIVLLMGFGLAADAAKPSPAEELLPESSRQCAGCHDELYNRFVAANAHARLKSFEWGAGLGGFEACHGNAQKHLDSGEKTDIFSFGDADEAKTNGMCMTCHKTGEFSQWAHGAHARNGLACTECHTIHKGKGRTAGNQMVLCGRCHADINAKMNYPSHHPVREGKMGCTSCHTPHAGAAVGSLKTAEQKNDLCLKCHNRYQGPFVFEHAPVVEDCTICHAPHGTAANNLLMQNEPFLCLQCHSAHFHMARIGDSTPHSGPSGDASNRWGASGWIRAYGTKCTQCHSQVHGSDLPSQGVSSHGGNLSR